MAIIQSNDLWEATGATVIAKQLRRIHTYPRPAAHIFFPDICNIFVQTI